MGPVGREFFILFSDTMKRSKRSWDASRGGLTGVDREMWQETKHMPRKKARTSGTNTLAVRQFVPRTPGGQIVADNHYWDVQGVIAGTAIPAATTTWTSGRIETYPGVTPGTTPLGCIFCPIEGNDISNRYGRKAFLKKIRLDAVIRVPPQVLQSTGDNGCVVRALLVQDKQTNGVSLTGDQVLSSGYINPMICSYQNTSNFGRFKVLKDRSFVMQNASIANDAAATGNIVQQGLVKTFSWSVKINEWVNFNSTNGGTVADIIDNSYHLIMGTDSTSLGPTVQYKCRCVFAA